MPVSRHIRAVKHQLAVIPPLRLLREVMAVAPGAIFLVSVSRPERLRELLSEEILRARLV